MGEQLGRLSSPMRQRKLPRASCPACVTQIIFSCHETSCRQNFENWRRQASTAETLTRTIPRRFSETSATRLGGSGAKCSVRRALSYGTDRWGFANFLRWQKAPCLSHNSSRRAPRLPCTERLFVVRL